MIDQNFRRRYLEIAQSRLRRDHGAHRAPSGGALSADAVHAVFERLAALLGDACSAADLAACADLGAGALTIEDIEAAYGVDLGEVRAYEVARRAMDDDELVQFAVRELRAVVAFPGWSDVEEVLA
jgi:hypothetical protein